MRPSGSVRARKPRGVRVAALIGAVLLLGALFWTGQSFVFSYAARSGLTWLFEKNGWQFSTESLDCGLGRAISIGGLSIRGSGGTAFGSTLTLERVEIVPNTLWEIVVEGRPLVGRVFIEGAQAYVDLRSAGRFLRSGTQEGTTTREPWRFVFKLAEDWCPVPHRITCANAAIDVVSDVSRVIVEGLDFDIQNGIPAPVECAYAQVSISSASRSMGPLRARVAWDRKKLGIAELEIAPGVVLNELTLRMQHLVDMALSFRATIFGGKVWGDVDLREVASGRIWDLAVHGSNVGLEGIADFLNLPAADASGRISEFRLTFRGEVGRPADADASLRLLAENVQWNSQECEMLEVASSLTQRRLVLSSFTLKQLGNTVVSNGEISLAEGWSKIAEAPFLINLRATLDDVGPLIRMANIGAVGLTGRVELKGSVSGRPGVLEGFLDVHGKGVGANSISVDQIDVLLVFLKDRIELSAFHANSGDDSLRAGGTIGLAAPYEYNAWLKANVADISKFSRLVPAARRRFVSSGSMELKWKGEGSNESNQGVFSLHVGDFVSHWTPTGVTGRFQGSYQPDELLLDMIELKNNRLSLGAKAGISRSGLVLKDVTLAGGDKLFVEGAAFFPIDLWNLREGGHWTKSIRRGREMQLSIKTPAPVEVAELARLAGQEYPVAGSLALEFVCRGLPELLAGNAHLELSGLRYGNNGAAKASIRAKLKNSGLECTGQIMADGIAPLDLQLNVEPFFYQQGTPDGRLINGTAKVDGKISFPSFDLRLLDSFLPFLGEFRGELTGELGVSQTLASPRIAGRIEIKDGFFSNAVASRDATGVAGEVEIEDGSVSISQLTGHVDGGDFQVSGTYDLRASEQPACDLLWVIKDVPLMSWNGVALPLSGRINAVGGKNAGRLSGELQIAPARIGAGVFVQPKLCVKGSNPGRWPRFNQSLSRLAPNEHWEMDVGIKSANPLTIGSGSLASGVHAVLRLGGSATQAALSGHIELPALKVEVPSGVLFADRATLSLLPEFPDDPFLYVEASGIIAGVEVKGIAWGPLSEGKWVLDSIPKGLPQDGYWLAQRGMIPLRFGPNQLSPVDVCLYPNLAGVAQPVSIRVVDETAWCGGIGLSRSLDFRPGAHSLPVEGYGFGFDWKLSEWN